VRMNIAGIVAEIDLEIAAYSSDVGSPGEGESPYGRTNRPIKTWTSIRQKDKDSRYILRIWKCRAQEEDERRGPRKNCCRSKGSLGQNAEEGLTDSRV
jgi:hypothetical protein